ncbi:pentatricopeptide repeat-containing protein At5g66520 [Mercurialis annua]|uniref:pentatricopeptide repeat-containing protein At5g66520 n=1 Tax=Mercurialis annua TaxID=3986 RepID=UPI00216085AC|nr:pentatricopeptide repeat-containing protein At5g66520 [Mercurialis annua]
MALVGLDSTMAQTLSLLDRCSTMVELKQIHAQMLKTGLHLESITTSKLLAFAASPSSGDLTYANTVFDRISRPNSFMWNAMIRGYADSNQPEQAFLFYHQMLTHSALHNSHTFPFLLKACLTIGETLQVHGHIIKLGFASQLYTANSLLHAYATFGFITSAKLLFDRIAEPDIVSWNSIIDAYMKCGDTVTAYQLFRDNPEKNAVSFTIMISGHIRAGLDEKALDLFQEMQIAGVKPDKVEMTSVLSACAHLGALDQGRWIHAYIKTNGMHIDPMLGCALINMYAKCGSMQEALAVFNRIGKKNIFVWTALLYGFAIHGQGREALNLLMQMQVEGLKPNLTTFTAILTACSYAGLVDEGKSIFDSMARVYGLNPTVEHYGCMVDLLGRAGLLKEAYDLIKEMPITPNAVILGTLLNACRIHGNVELGKQIAKYIIEIDPGHSGRYIHLANLHAAAGEWDEAAEARRTMKANGVIKLPGCSTISLDGAVHGFLAGDNSHPEIEKINCKWYQISERLRQEGYKPATQNLLLDLNDEEKETAMNQHSERLAVAFGLIRTKPRTTIRIVKNLRVCEDCHIVMKLVSKIYDREIIMRDRNRFHVFSNGKCTCADYW